MNYETRIFLPLIILFTLCILFAKLGTYPLVEPSDARYAEISREMFVTGDYLTPRLEGIKHFHKPPLLYWIVSVGYRFFGVNEWGARIFQGILALGVLLWVYLFGRRLYGKESSWLPPLLLTLTPGFLGAERNLTTDMLLLFLVTGALMFFYIYYLRKGKGKSIYIFYFMSGLSILTKGPMGLIVIIPVIILFLLFEENISFLLEMKLLRGTLIVLACSIPWYIVVGLRNPGLFRYFLVEQVLQRASGVGMGHRHPPYYYLYFLPLLAFPWVFFIASPVMEFFRSLLSTKVFPQGVRGEKAFLVIWTLFPPIFFSLTATKLPLYILPSLPPLALLASGRLLEISRGRGKDGRVSFVVISLLFLAIGGACIFGPALLSARKGIDLSGGVEAVGRFSGILLVGGGLLTLALIGNTRRVWKITVGTLAIVIMVVVFSFDKLPLPNSKAVAMEAVARERGVCPNIILYGTNVYGVPFYTKCPPTLVYINRDLRFEDRGFVPSIIKGEKFSLEWETRENLFLVTKTRRIPPLGGMEILLSEGGFSIGVNGAVYRGNR